MVDDFEIAGDGGLADLVDLFFFGTVGAVDDLLDFDLFGDLFGGPVDAGDVGAVVEAQAGCVAQEGGDGDGVVGVDEQRVLGRGAGVGERSPARQPGTSASSSDLNRASRFIRGCLR